MSSNFDLLTTVENGGCSAKIPPKLLDNLMSEFKILTPTPLVVGTETGDDAAVWISNPGQALIFTTDFFPPLCSDPYEFGQIAAANSLSDVYAMGGEPLMALNLVMFPSKKIDIGILKDILKGGADKVHEAGVALAGGHTIDDDGAPKYGLAVVGMAHPNEITTNRGLKAGDVLILTKPIGTGTILAGHRLDVVAKSELENVLNSMKRLNKSAAKIMRKYKVSAATDITGFSLFGHAYKMAKASNVTIHFKTKSIPLFPKVYELIDMGCIPGVSFSNLSYIEEETIFEKGVDYNLKMAGVDAQTSGGLLFAVNSLVAPSVIDDLKAEGLIDAAVVAEVVAKEERSLRIF